MKWLRSLWNARHRDVMPVPVTGVHMEAPYLYVIQIAGVLDKATLERIQTIMAQDIARGVHGLKVLVLLREFQGWKRREDWGDLDFFTLNDKVITKIAVVGDARWEAESLLFLAAGQRHGEVRYFSAADEAGARSWLAE